MKKLIVGLIYSCLLLPAAANAQCGGPNCGPGGQAAPTTGYIGGPITAKQSRDLCAVHMADIATRILKSTMANSTALNSHGRANEKISPEDIVNRPACAQVCGHYGAEHENWVNYSNADVKYTAEPAASLQKEWSNKAEPKMPDEAEVKSCYQTIEFSTTWCPDAAKAGPAADLGNGPKRLINPIDKTSVCGQAAVETTLFSLPPNLMKHAKDCGKFFEPDARVRYDQEVLCMNEAAKNDPVLNPNGPTLNILQPPQQGTPPRKVK